MIFVYLFEVEISGDPEADARGEGEQCIRAGAVCGRAGAGGGGVPRGRAGARVRAALLSAAAHAALPRAAARHGHGARHTAQVQVGALLRCGASHRDLYKSYSYLCSSNCRYLEDAIINLNPLDAVTRSHLPVVVREVRSHLTKFLTDYPNHVAGRRVALIIMAANNLLS